MTRTASPHLSDPLITLIAGPTASGKSALALERAVGSGAVILNADSQQLYADLRILSARPSAVDESMAEHRLYGVADAAEAWSAGRWTRAAMVELAALEGRPVLIVGGTGLYFTALTRGLADIPPVPGEVRTKMEDLYDSAGETAFRKDLAKVDPAAAARIETGDRQRLVRAGAVAAHTGRALTDWTTDTTPLLPPGAWSGLVLEPDRSTLYAACDARVDAMIAGGAVAEVAALQARSLDPALPAMKAVGVRELSGYNRGETSLGDAVMALKQTTRNYAKRQLTWFRNQMADWPRKTP